MRERGGREWKWEIWQRPYIRETMHSALKLISANRGRVSQPKMLSMATDCSATAGIGAAQISIT